MAYRARSWRNALGHPRDPYERDHRERDLLEDTATDLRRIVEEDSGRHERVGEILSKQAQLLTQVIKSNSDHKTRIAVLESRVSDLRTVVWALVGAGIVAFVEHLWKK